MVPRLVNTLVTAALLGLLGMGWLACAKKNYIDVDYRLPAAVDTLAGRTVSIETRDLRHDKEIFNERAKAKFEHFTGLFALHMDMPDHRSKVLGAYPLPKLFETALTQRLQKLGVDVTDKRLPDVPVFQLDINQFNINLIGRKWVAQTTYEASLTRDNQRVAREAVTGSAERLKVIGSGGAEDVIGDIFTEMINRLNIERLFKQAEP